MVKSFHDKRTHMNEKNSMPREEKAEKARAQTPQNIFVIVQCKSCGKCTTQYGPSDRDRQALPNVDSKQGVPHPGDTGREDVEAVDHRDVATQSGDADRESMEDADGQQVEAERVNDFDAVVSKGGQGARQELAKRVKKSERKQQQRLLQKSWEGQRVKKGGDNERPRSVWKMMTVTAVLCVAYSVVRPQQTSRPATRQQAKRRAYAERLDNEVKKASDQRPATK